MPTLMKYSGHTEERTLLRYLNWGRLAANLTTAMTKAGEALNGQSVPSTFRFLCIYSWSALTGQRQRVNLKLPIHVKPEVLGSLDLTKVLSLDMPAHLRADLKAAYRWLFWSPEYDAILEELHHIQRTHQQSIVGDQLSYLYSVGKIVDATQPPLAYCNSFWREEEKPEGNRLRGIFEPLINDLIPRDRVTVSYTSKETIRQRVLHTTGGAQFDFKAWFDQIPLDLAIRIFFGVTHNTTLPVLPMGFRPSCKAAEALTEAIACVPTAFEQDVFVATCVDNILYVGGEAPTRLVADNFLQRAKLVGAITKEPTCVFSQVYDFLGERYDHARKTRCLTERTQAKCVYAAAVLAHRRSFTLRQLAAIIGLLLYAANVLRICVGTYHYAMRFYASTIASLGPGDTYDTVIRPTTQVLSALRKWATRAAANVPVDVYRAHEVDLTIYVDASAIGWAAISVSPAGNLLQVARNWTHADRNIWQVDSSVVAESVGLRNAVHALVSTEMRCVKIFTDHLPIVWAAKRTFGRAFAYSWLLHALSAYKTVDFIICHVTGVMNPADELSRTTFGPDTSGATTSPSRTPKYLPVTHVWGFTERHKVKRGEWGRVDGMAGSRV